MFRNSYLDQLLRVVYGVLRLHLAHNLGFDLGGVHGDGELRECRFKCVLLRLSDGGSFLGREGCLTGRFD